MQNKEVSEIRIVLMCSWGMDGSTGHSAYLQHYTSEKDDVCLSDTSIFIVSLIPLGMLSGDNDVVWNKSFSESPSSCRPIQMLRTTESKEVVLSQKCEIEKQISELQTLKIKLNDKNIIIHFSLFLTLIDGKILNIITGTKSMQTCPICQATPKSFNDLSNIKKDIFIPNPKSLVYGLSPLHAWIRIFECCLHISYRLPVKSWQMRFDDQKSAYVQGNGISC